MDTTMCTDESRHLRTLMTMTSHDLRSPLTVIATHLQLLREDLGGQADADLTAMERAVHRIERMTDNLLEWARSDQTDLRLVTVALDALVADVVAEQTTPADGVLVTVDGPLPLVRADRELLRHVIDNLIGNAIKYTAPGAPARVEVSARRDRGGVQVEIADRGIGIPDGDRRQVFAAFHRAANSTGIQGTGLELAICRRIVERHGGDIEVTGNPGGGSRFRFTLPG